jgi:acetyl-CoA synthetase
MVLSSCAALFPPVPGAIGRAVPGHEIAVIDEDGTRVSGAEGDIAIKRGSPVMMLEYWRKPGAPADKFRGDWLVTGDRGIEENGVFRFIGRNDDVITSSGYRIGPAEIEDCLLKHPAVASAGVVGKPDRERTEIIVAYIVLRDGVAGDDNLVAELQSHVKTRLAAHEYPREIAFVDALPMTVTGKIIRKDLRRMAAATSGADA